MSRYRYEDHDNLVIGCRTCNNNDTSPGGLSHCKLGRKQSTFIVCLVKAPIGFKYTINDMVYERNNDGYTYESWEPNKKITKKFPYIFMNDFLSEEDFDLV